MHLDLQIFRETGKVFLESFKEYMKSVSEDCGIDPIATEPPIYVRTINISE